MTEWHYHGVAFWLGFSPMAEWHLYGVAFWLGFFFFFYFSPSLFLLVPDAMALWIVRFFTIYPDPYCPEVVGSTNHQQ